MKPSTERARARTREPDLDPAVRAALAPKIGIGAVKYADLANDRIKDYVFDWDRMLAEGRTVPISNTHTRGFTRSSVGRRNRPRERARRPSSRSASPPNVLSHSSCSASAPRCGGGGFAAAAPARRYVYDLATAFTAFFESCPVLRAPDDATRVAARALRAHGERARAASIARHRGAPERM
jgi:arginyl-tRNA synthetase